jgi:hypothetical protein
MIVLLVAALIAMLIVGRCLLRAPLATLACIGLIGFALHAGVVTLPAAIRTPAAQLSRDVHAWQQRQADTLSCELAQASAARTLADAALDRASRLCSATGPTAP